MVSARRLTLRGLVWLCALAGVALLCSAPALAAQGHSFLKSFGSEGSGPGQFKEPDGVAVNNSTGTSTSGDVYVVDKGNNRAERFDSEGGYLGVFGGTSASGVGTLASGSTTITEVVAGTGEFNVGQDVSAAGLPAGTKITAVLAGGVLEVSQAATASEVGALTAQQSFEGPTEVAVDSSVSGEDPSAGDVYVVDAGHKLIDKYTAEGEYIGQITGFSAERLFNNLSGVAVDQTGRLWVAAESIEIEFPPHGVGVFTNARSNEFGGIFFRFYSVGASGDVFSPGFALDSSGAFYVNGHFFTERNINKFAGGSSGGLVSPVRTMPFALTPLGLGVEPGGANDLYVSVAGLVERFASGDGSVVESFGSGRLVGGGGVGVSVSGTVFVADGVSGTVDVFPLEPPGKPSVLSEGVSNVTSSSATFEADLNPRDVQSSYRFEYGRCVSVAACATTGYESDLPVPDGVLSADFSVHGVSVHPQDLLPGSVYHFRVVATNALGSVEGEDRVFVTQGDGGGSGLLDGRQWELVSPPDKHGALVESIGNNRVTQASGNGDAFTFLASSPTESGPAGYAGLVQVFAGRGPGGWSSTDIAGSRDGASGAPLGADEFTFFSEDLGVGVVQPLGGFVPEFSDEASEQTAFLRNVFVNGNVSEPCVAGRGGSAGMACYTPLVTGCPAGGAPCRAAVAEHANVPAGTVFGEEGKCPPALVCGPRFEGGSPDGKHVVLRSSTPLVAGTPPGSLYEWSAGRLVLVSVPREGEPAPAGPALGDRGFAVRGAVSNDGSRVVWSEFHSGGHLFLRDLNRGETVELDAVQDGSFGGGAEPVFQFASSDGSRVFFTDTQPLTGDSGAGGVVSGKDLFECEMVVVAGKLSCRLSDLTPLHGVEQADVRSNVLGASSDGSYVYFVANGVLAAGATRGKCSGQGSVLGAMCSLYVWHDGTTSFVARLSFEDEPDWAEADPRPLSHMSARVSDSGRWVVFMSDRGLSGYDTRDLVTGKPVEEVYLFDASRPASAGASGANPVCVSCDPTGARPVGVEYRELQASQIDGELLQWRSDQLIAGSVPGWTTSAGGSSFYHARFLSDSGRVFFNSVGPLVAGDVNGAGDVYEFEPAGVGNCSENSSGFSVGSGGCVGLVSSGGSVEESGFLDASATGGDVFFYTSGALSPKDFDVSRDVYDAHECSNSAPCFPAPAVTPPGCVTGDSCKAAPSPQPALFGAPSSATFTGAGNVGPPVAAIVTRKGLTRAQEFSRALRTCHSKRNHRKRVVCERHTRKRFAAKKSSLSVASKNGGGR